MWDGSLVTWAREGTGMSCWAWGGIRIQGNGVGEYLGVGEVPGVCER